MLQIDTAYFIADGAAVYLPFGFVPNLFLMMDVPASSQNTNVDFYWFWELMEDYGSSGGTDGILVNEGVTAALASGSGINAYDTSADAPTVSAWTASSTPTARSASAHGTYVHPTIANTQGFDVNAIFECVTAGTGAATEPTWTKDPGGQVTDGTNVWERVDADVPIFKGGYKGVGIDAAITDGHYCYCLAIEAGHNHVWGDVTGWTSGIQGT